MKKLLKKEVTLAASPLTWFFMAFSAMTFIPGYPILVGSFFICLGIFYSFQFSREHNDTLYTALLPIRKSDVVKAKFIFTSSVELMSFVLITFFTVLRMRFLNGISPYAESPLMNANAAYLGYVLIIFAEFNIIFLSGFFKTAYNIGKPFILFCIAAFLTVFLGETLYHLPGLSSLNENGLNAAAAAVFIFGIAVYAAGTHLSLKLSQNRFDKIDL